LPHLEEDFDAHGSEGNRISMREESPARFGAPIPGAIGRAAACPGLPSWAHPHFSQSSSASNSPLQAHNEVEDLRRWERGQRPGPWQHIGASEGVILAHPLPPPHSFCVFCGFRQAYLSCNQ